MPPTDKRQSTCAWVSAHVDEYLDDMLDPDAAKRLQDHCSECEECAYELELARAVKDGLDALPLLHCPDDVTDRVFDEIAATNVLEARSTPVWLTVVRPLWRPISVAAAAAAVILMTLLVSTNRSPSPSQAEVDRALAEAKFALAVISHVGLQTGRQVGSDVSTTVIEPVQNVLDDKPRGNGL